MSSKKPNIILITTDQHHNSCIGKINLEIHTPNIDKLAEEGVLFTNAYSCDPTCTPSRSSILTGKYPSQHGAWSLGTKLDPEKNILLTDILRESGYRTTLIGKAHFEPLVGTDEYSSIDTRDNFTNLDFWREFSGPYYGFDHIELQRGHGNSEVGEHYLVWLNERLPNWKDYFTPPEGNLPEPPLLIGQLLKQQWKLPEKYHHSRWIQERSIANLDQFKNSGENFFMWVSFPDPHYPHACPEPWNSQYDLEKITIPKKKLGEHRKSNYLLKITQNPFMKLVLRISIGIPLLFNKLRRNKTRKHTGHKQPLSESDRAKKLSNFLQKLPWIKKILPLSRYLFDFIENEQVPYVIHGLHPHTHPLTKSLQAQSIAAMYGKISLIDDCIGKILERLEENGQKNDTIVIFTADHGDHFGQHGLYYKGPFPYDDGIKVPFITRVPNSKKKNKISSSYISLADIAPTILNLVDIDVPEKMVGIDQSNVLLGKENSARDHIICEFRQSPREIFMNTFVIDHFKIVFYYDKPFGELFDLKKNPQENHNLWDNHRYKKLKKRLLLDYIAKRSKDDFDSYSHIWKEWSLEQLLHVVHEYMQQSYRPDLMPRISGA